ncbi:MAG: PadR family transcriptional regulator [Planctomycetota bacterium]
MARENRTRFAILGMLMSGPKSGYDLKKDFEEQISHFWTESLGQIYPALKKLEKENLVTQKVVRQEARPDRKVYTVTPSGQQLFRDWLEQPAAPIKWRNELLLKVFFGTEMSTDAVLNHIVQLESEQKGVRQLYQYCEDEIDRRPGSPERKLYWKLALASGRHINKARLAWCREAKAAIHDYIENQTE